MKIKTISSFLSLLFAIMVLDSCAQTPDSIQWKLNYDALIKIAAKEKKPIFIFFHGSDWCPPCKRMQKEVFEKQDFIDFTADKVLFLDIDFPRNKKLSDEQLQHNKNVKKQLGLPDDITQGYPQVIIIDATEKVLYQEKGYSGEGPQKLIGIIHEVLNK